MLSKNAFQLRVPQRVLPPTATTHNNQRGKRPSPRSVTTTASWKRGSRHGARYALNTDHGQVQFIVNSKPDDDGNGCFKHPREAATVIGKLSELKRPALQGAFNAHGRFADAPYEPRWDTQAQSLLHAAG